MFSAISRSLFGSSNDRFLKKMQPLVEEINAKEADIESLSETEVKAFTISLKDRVAEGESLDAILPDAFAIVREAAKRVLGQRHYDVQLLGGIILHKGMIAEMKTGEGKTLVATLPAYLNALSGKSVHVVTVNDYLAERDASWMGRVHEYLGLTVSCIKHGMNDEERKAAYAADIVYATNNELGFDFLRDNMKFTLEQRVQRDHHFAIVDEVDSILIDEARTPLIISGPVDDNTALYTQIDKFIPGIKEAHYELDEKSKNATFTEDGTAFMEEQLHKAGLLPESSSLYDIENVQLVHHANQALRAHVLFHRDTDYIVKDGKVVIIDEFTGRMMEGRRYSDGLHQALEAKESVPIQQENQTLASVTFQNYFRGYDKLAGMTGTALTEEAEFADIYGLNVIAVPTHKPVARIDDDDSIYRTAEEKYLAIVEKIAECHKSKQPVLAGTVSIEKSELLSKMLKKAKIPHNVLNARQHDKEASIVGQAGKPGAVTIATNMAGRGTDIQLGGNAEMLIADKLKKDTTDKQREKITKDITAQVEKDREIVQQAGGLCVLATERHESRRIDNQLRGRAGRQGDAGYTKFYLSAQDDLIRIFGADKKMDWILGKMGKPGEPIESPMLTKVMEKSQKKVEERNYDIRKNLLKFDDVMNDQRKVIYEQRMEIMEAEAVDETIAEMLEEVIESSVLSYIPPGSYAEQWDTEGLDKDVFRLFGLHLDIPKLAAEEGVDDSVLIEKITQAATAQLEEKQERYGKEAVADIAKRLLLFTLDELWKEHLHSLDYLRQSIGLRAYGQKDPLNEYKQEAFSMFAAMLDRLRESVITRLSHVELGQDENGVVMFDRRQVQLQQAQETRQDPAMAGQAQAAEAQSGGNAPVQIRQSDKPFNKADPSTWGRVGRNQPCPCGSGKKYKQCHGKLV